MVSHLIVDFMQVFNLQTLSIAVSPEFPAHLLMEPLGKGLY